MRGCLAWVVGILAGFLLLSLLLGYGVGVEYLTLKYWLPTKENLTTEVRRNTNQYVETQQAKIAGLVRDHDRLSLYERTPDVQRSMDNLADQMCEAADKIDPQWVPEGAKEPMRQRGCWEGY